MERIETIHYLGYIHNDLKLENILVGRDDASLIHLIDFNLSCFKGVPDAVSNGGGAASLEGGVFAATLSAAS